MPSGFWKIYAQLTARLLGMFVFAGAMNWLVHVIADAIGVWSGWVMLALLATLIMAGTASAAYHIAKATD